MTDASYTTCASCQTFFYASQSRSVYNPPQPYPWPYYPAPYTAPPLGPVTIKPIWVVPTEPTVTCETSIGGTVSVTGDDTGCQIWN
jgi:hypothetical protein